jgi:hypothetical protein
MSEDAYSDYMQDKTAVAKGLDFEWAGIRYQVKANRPSGKSGSHVTLVPKSKNYDWDFLIWILYDTRYDIEEAWQWDVAAYQRRFHDKKRLSPADYRAGTRLA